jgi:type II secretory pathway predicted ATPase ExeA
MVNPFRPSAGANPPALIGRDEVLDEFEESLKAGPGSPYRLLRITGSRGSGKTVLLNALGQRAKKLHWDVIDETASEDFITRLIIALRESKLEHIKSFSLPSIGIEGLGNAALGSIEFSDRALPMTLRESMTKRIEHISKHHTDRGLFITLDETQGADATELRALAIATQHLIRENLNIAIAFAGLPGMASSLLHGNVTTFLRRAAPISLKDIPYDLVRESFTHVMRENGYSIDADALETATEATQGYPFMIQLVGYNIWRKATNNHIDLAAAESGAEAAKIRLGGTVHEPAIENLSEVDRTYLLAMAQDEGPSRTSDIAQRLDKDVQYAGRYRERLIQSGIIFASSYGYVDFTIPYLRQWLQEHAATVLMNPGE